MPRPEGSGGGSENGVALGGEHAGQIGAILLSQRLEFLTELEGALARLHAKEIAARGHEGHRLGGIGHLVSPLIRGGVPGCDGGQTCINRKKQQEGNARRCNFLLRYTAAAMKSAIVLLCLLAFPAIAGEARVIDGDTLEVAGARYRLHGIDAPETRQVCRRGGVDWLCGQEAAAYLRQLVQAQDVQCEARDRDRYGRVVAVCRAGSLDLNREMVAAGLAWAYRKYSRDYEAIEEEAKAAGRGVWSAEAIPPWEWRRRQ
jgi:endonuclease YncB( thermonuclease family)